MPAGRPSKAGTSKDSMARTKRVKTVATIAGMASLRVMRQSVLKMLDPLITADSSKEGSMALNAADINKKAMGE